MTEKLRILVVDDTKYVRDHIKSVLEDAYIVDTANSRDDAIKKFQIASKQSFTYDLVLLDNYLPDRDQGIDVLYYIRDNKIDTIALMISSHTEIESEPFKTGMLAFQAGAMDFLPKPFRNTELKEKIERLIVKKKQASAILEMAGYSDPMNFEAQFNDLLNDNEVDMMTKERIKMLLQGNNGEEDENFTNEPRNIEVSGSSTKSHTNMWNKRINDINDIPAVPRNGIFKVIVSHKLVEKIKFTKFEHPGIHTDYKIRFRDALLNSGQIQASLYGPSPISCCQQDFIIYVEPGFEQKVKTDLETRLHDFCK